MLVIERYQTEYTVNDRAYTSDSGDMWLIMQIIVNNRNDLQIRLVLAHAPFTALHVYNDRGTWYALDHRYNQIRITDNATLAILESIREQIFTKS